MSPKGVGMIGTSMIDTEFYVSKTCDEFAYDKAVCIICYWFMP